MFLHLFIFLFCRSKPFEVFFSDMNKDYLYSEDAPYMGALIDTFVTTDIVKSSMFNGGSQVKLDFTLADGNRVMVKPMR